jgi:uncharacterized protein YqeY
MMLAELVNKEKEKGESVNDETAVKIFYSMIKKREEAAEQFANAGREESAQKERAEIVIIKGYLPPQLSEDEIREETRRVIAEVGASDLKAMGKVMGILTKKLSGKASGSEISRIVKEELTGSQ